MLNVSMAVARAVIHRELSLDSSSIQQAIHSILNDLPKADKGFSLKINSRDEPFIKPILDRYESSITLKLDETITQGGCVLNSSSQFIDYTIEKRFQKIVQAMLSEALQGGSAQSNVEVPSSIGALSDYPSDTLEEDENIEINKLNSSSENPNLGESTDDK
jgi:flagellar assembly protein FliH